MTQHRDDDDAQPAHDAMRLLGAGVPISLLLDLALGDPHSEDLFHDEDDQAVTWLHGVA